MIGGIYNDAFISVSFSKNEKKHLFKAYLFHLILVASGKQLQPVFLSQSGEVYTGTALDQEEATKRLAELIRFYKNAHGTIHTFHFDLKIKPTEVPGLKPEVFSKARSALFKNEFSPCNDQYANHAFKNGLFDHESAFHSYKKAAELLLAPLAFFYSTYNFK